MYHYNFTNDLRISNLDEILKSAAVAFLSDSVPSATEDKSTNNNYNTLGFYFNLKAKGKCARLASTGRVKKLVLNFVKKFQFPNPRTPNDLQNSQADGITLAPMRDIVKLLHLLSLIDATEAYLTEEDVANFIFFNEDLAKRQNYNLLNTASQIIQSRKDGLIPTNIETNESEREWKHFDRQIREMIKTLNYTGCVFVEDGKLFLRNSNISRENEADLFEILNCNSYWNGSTVEDYQTYMDEIEMEDEDYLDDKSNLSTTDGHSRIFNKILFGAPGTGKSFILNQNAEKAFDSNCVERVTFHPNYSFAQFVGTYKPVQDEFDPEKIRYEYVPGPFMRTFANSYFNEKSYNARIKEIVRNASDAQNNKVNYFVAPCNLSDWNFFKKVKHIGQHEWWRNPPKDIKEGDIVFVFVGDKGIGLTKDTHESGVYGVATVTSSGSKEFEGRSWINLRFDEISFETPLIDSERFKSINPGNNIQNFQSKTDGAELIVEAKEKLGKFSPRNHLLLIEEINRANVAAVFGDVFQLLDRKDGVSEYPIAASEDVKRYLRDNGISDCEELKIPGNMYIWATMNSADQGVFPMDTAFKRRWEFEYIGIDKNETWDYTISLPNNETINWNVLRKAINSSLKKISSVNEDKLLGPYFLSKSVLEDATKLNNAADNSDDDKKKVDAFLKTFKSKVLMYLFEDVCKMRPKDVFKDVSVDDGQERMHYSDICASFDKTGIKIFGFEKAVIEETYKKPVTP